MRRRDVITLVGAAAAWPLPAGAQQPRPLTIGFLSGGTPSSSSVWTGVFAQRLHELGWIEGRTVAIVYRFAEGRRERYSEIAGDLVRLNVDVIVTSGTALPAVKQATSTIPIVFGMAQDPVGTGLSRASPAPVATSRDSRRSSPIRPASASKSCARSFPIFSGWRSWPISRMPA